MRSAVLLAALCAVLLASNADARPKHHHRTSVQKMHISAGCSDPVFRPCGGWLNFEPIVRHHTKSLKSRRNSRKPGRFGTTHSNTVRPLPPGLRRVMAEGAGRVVSHPPGCPRRAFCGCGAAVRIFGKPIRSLWLARNWFRFPRTSPAPGTVAVRRDGHHVVVLERHVSGSTWLVYDANSGRGKTRIHRRSITGWTIVDPSGA